MKYVRDLSGDMHHQFSLNPKRCCHGSGVIFKVVVVVEGELSFIGRCEMDGVIASGDKVQVFL